MRRNPGLKKPADRGEVLQKVDITMTMPMLEQYRNRVKLRSVACVSAEQQYYRNAVKKIGVPVTCAWSIRGQERLQRKEVHPMARACVECCACDVAGVHTPLRITTSCGPFGLGPEFCMDLTARNFNGCH